MKGLDSFAPFTVSYLASGKRSHVFVLKQGTSTFCLKVERPEIAAVDRVLNEAVFLLILNEVQIGPTLVACEPNYILYTFVDGKLILDYLAFARSPWSVLKKVFLQCRTLDEFGINKLEMHKPVKHIFVKNGRVFMIDFERCYFSRRPKNVSQFAQFLLRSNVRALLRGKVHYRTDSVRRACQVYQAKQSGENFLNVLKCFS